ncbi:uncharacterized protein LOC126836470 isoform X1 [Adelges cooleyi]|uniref:uncharacterized protein LOC126836470 isoform X1 n=1 Tax=Adelges cooleyi TaxID=133065 RepID=UPI0021804B05|nr:uncharacterized protein LOC126836470 isoform X1 [Adelges cooleyi]XP_050425884.1 uncharacterized protein LOC126836470 isoform X1 [Adelges cooleyi]
MLVFHTAQALLVLYTVSTSSAAKVLVAKDEVYDVKSMLNGPMSVDESGNVIIKVIVVPDYKHDGVLDVNGKYIKLRVRVTDISRSFDSSVFARLNSPLKNYLSYILGVSINDIAVIQKDLGTSNCLLGRMSQDKTVIISGYNQDVESYVKNILYSLRSEREKETNIFKRLYNFILDKFQPKLHEKPTMMYMKLKL